MTRSCKKKVSSEALTTGGSTSGAGNISEGAVADDRFVREQELHATGAQPSLREQLGALTQEAMEVRLEALGEVVRQPRPEEIVPGFQAVRNSELLGTLCAAYAARADSRPRTLIHDTGVPLPTTAVNELLEAVRKIDWKENLRPSVTSSGYIVLKRSKIESQPRYHERDPKSFRQRVWELAEALLRGASLKASTFHYTHLVVTKNFRGSPHIDKNDLSVQYVLSLGEFEEGGGKLCIEEGPFQVRAFETHDRLVCVDGRYPHWVSGYEGERYSIVYYRSSGVEDPSVKAVHDV